jgi:hypothetical protein
VTPVCLYWWWGGLHTPWVAGQCSSQRYSLPLATTELPGEAITQPLQLDQLKKVRNTLVVIQLQVAHLHRQQQAITAEAQYKTTSCATLPRPRPRAHSPPART